MLVHFWSLTVERRTVLTCWRVAGAGGDDGAAPAAGGAQPCRGAGRAAVPLHPRRDGHGHAARHPALTRARMMRVEDEDGDGRGGVKRATRGLQVRVRGKGRAVRGRVKRCFLPLASRSLSLTFKFAASRLGAVCRCRGRGRGRQALFLRDSTSPCNVYLST
eukprot:3787001-Rhodomonas_salina.1